MGEFQIFQSYSSNLIAVHVAEIQISIFARNVNIRDFSIPPHLLHGLGVVAEQRTKFAVELFDFVRINDCRLKHRMMAARFLSMPIISVQYRTILQISKFISTIISTQNYIGIGIGVQHIPGILY